MSAETRVNPTPPALRLIRNTCAGVERGDGSRTVRSSSARRRPPDVRSGSRADGADQPFGLAQGEPDHRAQGQGHQDRLAGVGRLPAPGRLGASAVNRAARLLRSRRLASYSRQFVTLNFCRGCGGDGRHWLGTAQGIPGRSITVPLPRAAPIANRRIPATGLLKILRRSDVLVRMAL